MSNFSKVLERLTEKQEAWVKEDGKDEFVCLVNGKTVKTCKTKAEADEFIAAYKKKNPKCESIVEGNVTCGHCNDTTPSGKKCKKCGVTLPQKETEDDQSLSKKQNKMWA